MQTQNPDTQISQILGESRDLPKDPQQEQIVMWRIFRDKNDALEYSQHILLEPDQRIVGGRSVDSAGDFFWLGVEVADLGAWGHTQAIQLADPFDGKGQGFTS